jgi:two-component system, NarL family, nitrate/nitrite response regulator NarL
MTLSPSSADPIRIIVVADVRLYREGLAGRLASRPELAVVGSAGHRDEALALLATAEPHVVVLDMAMRDSLQAVRAIRSQDPTIRIVAFAVDESEGNISACAEAGVAGYVPCEGSTDDLVETIRSCTRGELICSPRIAAMLFRRLCSLAGGGIERTGGSSLIEGCPLTGREQQVVELIDAGLSNKEIAQQLNIEVATVKNHVHNILEKLQVTTRREAAARLRSHTARGERALARQLPGMHVGPGSRSSPIS